MCEEKLFLNTRNTLAFWRSELYVIGMVFLVREVSYKEIKTEIRLLKLNKASHYSDIPTKIIKQNFIYESIMDDNWFSVYVYRIDINKSLLKQTTCMKNIFASCLKHADVTPLHEKSN